MARRGPGTLTTVVLRVAHARLCPAVWLLSQQVSSSGPELVVGLASADTL